MLGAQADPEMREAIFQWWHTRNNSQANEGHYADGQPAETHVANTAKQEAPEEELTPPPADVFSMVYLLRSSLLRRILLSGTRARGRRPFDPEK